MNFLDNVFPLQYPMYKPAIHEEGRGWLLALLLRTKSLYHGALAVSAYHRRVRMLSKSGPPCRIACSIDQGKHLEICLAEFRQSMDPINKSVCGACLSQGIGMVALIVQLIFFEVLSLQMASCSVLTLLLSYLPAKGIYGRSIFEQQRICIIEDIERS